MNPVAFVLMVLVIVIVFVGPWHTYSTDWGYYPSGLFFVLFLILLLWLLFGGRRLP
jgi:MFS superfamily sulfate permease-like transporter